MQLLDEELSIVFVVEEDLIPEHLGAARIGVFDASFFHDFRIRVGLCHNTHRNRVPESPLLI
jgi:hypothetical protein